MKICAANTDNTLTRLDMVTWSTDGVDVSFANGALMAEAPMAGSQRFMRWRITQP